MNTSSRQDRIALAVHVILRVAVCMCFVGHGAFGLRQKLDWLVFFDRFGIPDHIAFLLMPVIGTVDICLGISALVRPTKALLVYMVLWGTVTALLRPLAGMSIFEAVERAGNVGPTIALLLSTGPGWFSAAGVLPLDESNRSRLTRVLAWTTGLLMVGHGGLGAVHAKAGLVKHWGLLGLPVPNVTAFTRVVGVVEMWFGLAVLRWPLVPLCLAISVWKMGTEALFIVAGDPFWEWIERGGSYGAPLALALVMLARPTRAVVATAKRQATLRTESVKVSAVRPI
jgi:hypothetical protein